jgi:hypothetical protein
MQDDFLHIGTIQFYNEYFVKNEPYLFDMRVQNETKKDLLNLNIILKPFNAGFHILAGDKELLQNEWKPLRFHFFIRDPLFLNYTELEDFSPQKKLIFLSNRLVFTSTDGNALKTHEEDFVGKINISIINFGKLLTVDEIGDQDLKIADEAGNSIAAVQIDNKNNILDEGNYSIFLNGINDNRYFFPQSFFKVPHLVFSLYPDKLLEHYQSNKPVLYQVKFKSLSTKWRYIFTDPSFKKFPSLGIKDIKKDSYPFIEKNQLLNGLGTVRLFESKERIKLKDSYSGDFQLIENPDSEPKKRNIILKTLPSASPEVIYHDDSSSKDIYSHIFI